MDLIFYFSGTGNSLNSAKIIGNGLGNCEIISMNKEYIFEKSYERIGFVFPCYSGGLPNIVKNFIAGLDLTLNKNAYFFGIVTCAVSSLNSLHDLNKLLLEKNIKLKYGKELKSVSNFIIIYNTPVNQKVLDKSNEKLENIIKDIAGKKIITKYRNILFFSSLHNKFVKIFPKLGKEFNVSDNCNCCMTCIKICPVKNIILKDNKPEYLNKCEQCMACIQWCPQKAINYKNKTQNRSRYHNPNISVKELINN
jgi:ferredoxin